MYKTNRISVAAVRILGVLQKICSAGLEMTRSVFNHMYRIPRTFGNILDIVWPIAVAPDIPRKLDASIQLGLKNVAFI
jgi:hypothetical protein